MAHADTTNPGPTKPEPEKKEQQKAAPATPVVPNGYEACKILVPIDFSDLSLEALRIAAPLAAAWNGELILAHVIEPAGWLEGIPHETILINEKELARRVQIKLERVATNEVDRKVPVRCYVRTGRAYQELIELARELHVGLIVIATHGYTGFKRALLGSVAERVVQHAPCSVWVMRPTAQPPGAKRLKKKTQPE